MSASSIPYLDRATLAGLLDYPSLMEAIRDTLKETGVGKAQVPLREHYQLDDEPNPKAQEHRDKAEKTHDSNRRAALLVMPVWQPSRYIACKLATIFPGNPDKGLPSINGLVCLFDGKTGLPLAVMDAAELTARRTAAVSALATSRLARKKAVRYLILGTGNLLPYMAEATLSVRPLQKIKVWGRNLEKARIAAKTLKEILPSPPAISSASSLEQAVSEADIVTAITSSRYPLICGEWIGPGTHLDLVGAYRPDMREADDACLRRAALYVDTMEGATHEAGELLDPLARQVIAKSDIRGELADLAKAADTLRRDEQEITLFKSVGFAIADLAAAVLAWARFIGKEQN